MSFISAGAAITLGGTAVYPAISTANGAGAGGAIVVGTKITVGSLTSTGTAVGGAITLGREVVAGAVLTTGSAGGAVTLGDECTVTTITSKPLVAPNGGGLITIADDCSTGNIDTSGTVAATMGGVMIIGDRCEMGTLNSDGLAGGANITMGEGNLFGSIDTRSTTSGNGGSITMTHRNIMVGTIDCSGFTNGGVISIGVNNAFTGSGAIIANGTNGTSGPIAFSDGGRFDALTANAGTTVGAISYGKFCVIGNIIAGSVAGASSGITLGDGCTINGGVNLNSVTTGNCTIGNSVTITAEFTNNTTSGNAGSITVGRGCNLQGVRAFTSTGGNAGGITIGASTTALVIQCSTGGGAGTLGGNVSIGAGANVTLIFSRSTNAGGDSGTIIMEPGSTATALDSSSISGLGGDITLKNSNIITGSAGLSIITGTSNPGDILSINSKISDQIDNVTGASIFRDLIGSTPAANRDFIANVTADGSQYTNCLIVPNGTGVSINAAVPRTVIAYQFLQKNPFPANITLSEGSETTSINLLAP